MSTWGTRNREDPPARTIPPEVERRVATPPAYESQQRYKSIRAEHLAVDTLDAISGDIGTITAGVLQSEDETFVLDLDDPLLTITDEQAIPVDRLYIGNLGPGVEDYGLEVYDELGDLVLGATGLGDNVVGATNLSAINLGVGKFIRSTSYTPGSDGWSIEDDGFAEFDDIVARGSVTATEGAVGGWSITSADLSAGNVTIDAANEQIRMGSGVTGPTTGVGIFQGLFSGAYQFRVGDPSGDQIYWDGTNLNVTGGGTFSGTLSAATGTFAGDLSAAGGTFDGDLNAAGGTFSGALSAATGTFSGDLSAAGGTFTGTLSGVDGDFSGSLSAATGTFAGNLSAAGGTFTGTLSAVDGTFSGTLSAVDGSFEGTVSGITGSFSTLEAGLLTESLTDSRFEIDLSGQTLRVWDTDGLGQQVTQRVVIGRIGGGNDDYGLQIFDASGATVLNASGSGAVTFGGDLDAAGGTFSGDISAASGTFTGDLSGSTITGGSINIGGGSFQVTSGGALTATSATISGTITSGSTIAASDFTAAAATFTGVINVTSGVLGDIQIGGGTVDFDDGAATVGISGSDLVLQGNLVTFAHTGGAPTASNISELLTVLDLLGLVSDTS